jgi:large subunit ribosomal protein L22
MEAKATAKFVRMSPRKVRFVMDTIRGKYAADALAQLKFTPNHAAAEIEKVLRSAMANAENNHSMNPDSLKVTRCYVDGGPTLKRVQPRAQGRAYRILKRTSHITVVVEEAAPPPKKTGKTKRVLPPLRAALPTPAAPPAAGDPTEAAPGAANGEEAIAANPAATLVDTAAPADPADAPAAAPAPEGDAAASAAAPATDRPAASEQ